MIRSAIAFLLFSLLAGCYRQGDGIVVPFDHPVSPYAQPAPPIAVPPIQGPDAEAIVPDVEGTGAVPASTTQSPPHQHHH